jgi:CO dehydrogenase maturation factor
LDEEAKPFPAMGLEIDRIKEYLRGTNPRISSVTFMVRTTPPGAGSRLLRLDERNPVYAHFQREVDGVRLMVTGPFQESDLGLPATTPRWARSSCSSTTCWTARASTSWST